MYASIYEMNGTIIGGFGSLEGWTPGYFALADKERLIRDGIMEP
jgi:ABC-type lipoprotein release transport system permease subunit